MNLILLKRFNNYFNRQIFKYDQIDDYYDHSDAYVNMQNINFVPNDGAMTTQIINWNETWNPDYLLVVNEYQEIQSRWFIVESIRTRGRQYKLTLKRDVIADNLNEIIDAKIYVEKSKINDINDPAIYNSEGLPVNKIKKEDLDLKDSSKSAWIVGYYNKKNKNDKAEDTFDWEVNNEVVKNYLDVSDLPSYLKFDKNHKWSYWWSATAKYKTTGYQSLYDAYYGILEVSGNQFHRYTIEKGKSIFPNTAEELVTFKDYSGYLSDNFKKVSDELNQKLNKSGSTEYNKLHEGFSIGFNYFLNGNEFNGNKYNKYIGYSSENPRNGYYNDLLHYNNEIVKTSDGKMYRIIIKSEPITGEAPKATFQLASQVWFGKATYALLDLYKKNSPYNYISKIENEPGIDSGTVDIWAVNRLTVSFKEIYNYPSKLHTKFSIAGELNLPMRVHSNDSVYDIFYIPYTNNLYINGKKTIWNKELALSSATSIATLSGGASQINSFCYDIQLLPYAPSLQFINFGDTNENKLSINLAKATEGREFNYIKSDKEEIVGLLLWAPLSQRTFDIDAPKIDWLQDHSDIFNKKISNECDIVRLCSPNYNSMFEITPEKNGGIQSFNVDCTFMPVSPYIHINPNFKKLYGRDFNDSRGLICNGDYSLPVINDQWINYQISNKNYDSIFDRGISNMEVNHKYDMLNKEISATAGALSAGIGAGFMTGNIFAGLGVGAASAAAGMADIEIEKKRYNENKSYKTDMYNMSLENIQALPEGISKGTPLTFNNRIFPRLEYYTCTDIEKKALLNKMIYNGMTINRIGTLKDYYDNRNGEFFFKGQLIRSERISDDSHIAHEIYNELDKGIFIGG